MIIIIIRILHIQFFETNTKDEKTKIYFRVFI